jgi:hypothetical protein
MTTSQSSGNLASSISNVSPNALASTASTISQTPLSANFDPRIPTEIDPPGDAFRAQLICEILNTCGSYYVRGQAKEKLSRFLIFFQRYLLAKPSIPLHIEFSVLDTFDSLESLALAAMTEKSSKGKGL